MVKKPFVCLMAAWMVSVVSAFSIGQNTDPFFQDPFGDEIFKQMRDLQKEMDQMFERMHQRITERAKRFSNTPVAAFSTKEPIGFIKKNDRYELRTTIPQSAQNHIDIQIKNGILSITAKVVEKKEHNTSNGVETLRSVRMYQNAFSIPKDADISSLDTKYEDNFLVLYLKTKNSTQMPDHNRTKVKPQPAKQAM